MQIFVLAIRWLIASLLAVAVILLSFSGTSLPRSPFSCHAHQSQIYFLSIKFFNRRGVGYFTLLSKIFSKILSEFSIIILYYQYFIF